ncbi:MAG TPA: HlyD family efflux transporter periplasmic adaptor subunit [Methylomirabilota bacterium]|nr:HlyD family efflux transporter periplasmic adaptor subunit [Methylomirabilota bacterium]
MAVVMMWKNYVSPSGVVGEVEAVRASASVVEPGTLTELAVDLIQKVTKGQPLGTVAISDAAAQEAELNAIAADMRLLKARMDLDRTRNLDTYLRLKLDMVDEQLALEMAKVRLVEAGRQFERIKTLMEAGIASRGSAVEGASVVSLGGYDAALRDRDTLQAEVEWRTKAIAEYQKAITAMEATGLINVPPSDALIEENIKYQQEQIRLVGKPAVLKAPIDGIISAIHVRPGEKVLPGQPVVTIASPSSERILAYIRAPVTVQPEVGMQVEIRPRSQKRQIGIGQVLGVGVQMESISTARFSSGMSSNVFEQALPIVVSLPNELKLLPGEVVDLSLRGMPAAGTP